MALATILAAVPQIASLAGQIFGKDKKGGETVSQEQMIPEWQNHSRVGILRLVR